VYCLGSVLQVKSRCCTKSVVGYEYTLSCVRGYGSTVLVIRRQALPLSHLNLNFTTLTALRTAARELPSFLDMDENPRQDGSNAHEETQNSLRQASSALELAYHRIRQLRHSLLELADSMPPSDLQSEIPNPTSIGPAHEAILLSGQSTGDQDDRPVLDIARFRSSLPPSVMERLENFESEYLPDQPNDRLPEPSAPPPAPSGSTTRPLPPSRSSLFDINSPTVLPRNSIIHPRRSLLELQLSRHRDVNPDDPSTALGRRVAAREAGEFPADSPIHQLERFLVNTTAVIARSLDNITTRLNQRSQTLDFNRQAGIDPRTRRVLEGTNTRWIRSPSVGATQNLSNSLSSRQPSNRRWRAVMRPESAVRSTPSPSAQSGQSSSTRLSVLSNFSAVENLSSPLTPLSRERPILFDEPASYVLPNPPGEAPFEEDSEMNAADRNYVIRRRMNADGDEFVHSLSMSWNDVEEDRTPWLTPQQHYDNITPFRSVRRSVVDVPPGTDAVLVTRSATSPSGEPTRRRRGWGTYSSPTTLHSYLLT